MSYGDMMSQKNAKIQTITKITKVRYKEKRCMLTTRNTLNICQ